MLGDMIGELSGKVVGQRVIPGHHHMGGPLKVERTIELKGKILGQEVTMFLATFWSMERTQGGVFSMGNGLLMTKDGGRAQVRGAGISVPSKGPGWSIRGTRYFQTASPALKRLNDVAVVFESEISPDGTIRDKWWEWK